MLNRLKHILTSKRFYAIAGGLLIAATLTVILLDEVIMPSYTNYDEGVTVPNVTRLSLSEAEMLLNSYGLRVEVADRRSNSAFPADYVIDQTPEAAKIVKPNRKVYLTVNAVTTPKVEVPEVVNLSYRNAEIQLQNHGLKVGTVSYESSRFKNSVLRQSIPAGRIVDKGTVIDLAVSDGLGQKMVTIPKIIGLSLSEAQQELRKVGLRVGEIRFQPVREVPPNTIIDYAPAKDEVVEGETLKLLVSEREDAKEESESGAVRVDSAHVADPDSLQNQ